MFYEEKVLNGVLHYRNIPGGAWIEVSKEVLTEKYLREKDNNGGYAQLADVRELVEMVEAIPCICEECYTSRKLTQPDCPKCNYIEVDIINKVKAHFS